MRGLQFDECTPDNKLKDVLNLKCAAVIRDPRSTTVRVLMM